MAVNHASQEFLKQLASIEPSVVYGETKHFPCSARLRDGRFLERVICLEERRGIQNDSYLHPEEVLEISPSPFRLPAKLASQLYGAGESGMGYECFTAIPKQGESFTCITYNIVDFPDLPPGLFGHDIASVIPHSGRELYGTSRCFERRIEFTWCYFQR